MIDTIKILSNYSIYLYTPLQNTWKSIEIISKFSKLCYFSPSKFWRKNPYFQVNLIICQVFQFQQWSIYLFIVRFCISYSFLLAFYFTLTQCIQIMGKFWSRHPLLPWTWTLCGGKNTHTSYPTRYCVKHLWADHRISTARKEKGR